MAINFPPTVYSLWPSVIVALLIYYKGSRAAILSGGDTGVGQTHTQRIKQWGWLHFLKAAVGCKMCYEEEEEKIRKKTRSHWKHPRKKHLAPLGLYMNANVRDYSGNPESPPWKPEKETIRSKYFGV